MIAIYDNLTATLVASVILLIVLSMQMRMRDANIQQTAHDIAKRHALQTGDWLQQDLGNVGGGVPINGDIFSDNYHLDDAEENTIRFGFYRKINDTDPTPTEITYELVKSETITVDGTDIPLYQLNRCEGAAACPAGSANINGQSPGLLTYFRIDFLDADGKDWTSPDNAYYLRVRFGMTSPMRTVGSELRETFWGTVLPLRDPDA